MGGRGAVLGDFLLNLMATSYSQEESMMDRAASAGFEGIAQMLLEQKKLMDALEAENRELRRQIADLRRGIGVAVVIDGKTIQLATDSGSATSQATLQSFQNLQNTQNGGSYVSRQTGGQQAVGGVGEKQNGAGRSPLADSFVL
jgi:hypothetical protein